MTKRTKTTKEDINKRRSILKELVRYTHIETTAKLLSALNEELLTKKLNKIEESTLRRDMNELKIIKSPKDNYYVDSQFLVEETDKNSILQSIKPFVKGTVISDMNFLAVEVTADTADLVGKKILQLYGSTFFDYIPARNTLLLLLRPDSVKNGKQILSNILLSNTPLY